MNNRFELLDEADVVHLLQENCPQLNVSQFWLTSDTTFKVEKILLNLACKIIDNHPMNWNNDNVIKLRQWFENIDCEVLKVGSSSWQKGKVRIKTSIEFCPDDYDSPLEEIRSQES